jgi:hypothetical protein
LFHPWRVLLTPTVQTSTARASGVQRRAGAAVNTSALARDSNVIVVYSSARGISGGRPPPACSEELKSCLR